MEEGTKKMLAQTGVPKSGLETRFSVPSGNPTRVEGLGVGPRGTWQKPVLYILWPWGGCAGY